MKKIKMDTIKDPSQEKLSILLVPVALMCFFSIIFRIMQTWMTVVIVASLAIYMALITYYCIKQKCYVQLGSNWLILFMLGIFFLIT